VRDEVTAALPANVRPVSWTAERYSPAITGVTPSARYTVPSVGSPVTITLRSASGKEESTGAAIPIVFGALPEATVSEAGVVVKLIPSPFRIDYPSTFDPACRGRTVNLCYDRLRSDKRA